jgi:hypothetical protein
VCFHPAYPTAADLSRETAAIRRDLADIADLGRARSIVTSAIAKLSRLDPIRHPDARWSLVDLTELLEGALTDIDGTAAMIRRSPLVLEEAA